VPPIISAAGRDFRSRALQPESLPSDGKFKLVAVERRKLKPRIYHLAVPVTYRGAFLQAEVRNEHHEPLLSGEARVFLGTDYMGAVFLDNVEPGGAFTVPLGVDDGVKLARHAKVQRSESGFKKRLRRTEYQVTVEAANRKARPVEIVVVDRVPRPSDARIRVADLKFRGGTPEYDPESDSGEVRFTIKVKPGEVASVGIDYAVEHPSDLEAVGERRK
jgi:uncharacterized protein (TIGR02231 family)